MYSFRIPSLVGPNSIMGLNHLSLDTESTPSNPKRKGFAFSNLVDTKDTQTKKTSKILQKALILTDLKRYYMEEKEGI